MSTLSISPAFAPHFERPTARLTRRGRVVLVLGFLVLALALMTLFGGWATATHQSGKPETVSVVTVGPGDTLYDIAGRVAQPGQVRSMVHHIQELNSLSGASLQVGQQIAIPRS
jgi:predicted Zn-dependent protease